MQFRIPVFMKGNIMAKQKIQTPATEAAPVDYKSLRDFGYSVAKKSDAVRLDGAWALDHIPGFPDELSKDNKGELYEGFRLRYSELHPEKPFAVIDGNYLPVAQLAADAKPKEILNIGVVHAFSYTQQEFGALKESDFAKYQLIKGIREDVSKYCWNCLNDLKNAARRALAARNPESKTRAANDNFNVAAAKILDRLKDRCKNAAARSDSTADMKAIDAAIVAFKVKYESLTGTAITAN